mmetsp:Transcript_93248/g.216715  ORF Transcript_93248/g.216715 Transcript_93248/m.216715 type:complete len:354 (-) Transcript_93248:98-1159(-)
MGSCNCKSSEVQGFEVHEEIISNQSVTTTLTVVIIGARGVRGRDWFPGNGRFLYCTLSCVPAGNREERIRRHTTKRVKDTLAPTWNDEVVVEAFRLGDGLELAIWDAGPTDQSDLVGSVVLEAEEFEHSFNGELQLRGHKHKIETFLQAKIKMEDQDYPLEPEREFRVLLDLPERHSLGLTFDAQDGIMLHVLEVGKGEIDQHNKVADDDVQVRPHDYIVKVNGLEGSSAQLLSEIKKATQLELLVRRPWQFSIAVSCSNTKRGPGLMLKSPSGSALVVAGVKEGPVKDWNTAFPAQAVRVGDRIIAVDGEIGSASRLQKLMKASHFHLTIERPASPPEWLNILKGTKDLNQP